MVQADGTMTTVEQASSTSQLDTEKGNGHVQSTLSVQSSFENGDSKLENIKATLENSKFGVIFSPTSSNGSEGLLSKKPDRVKIVVKRKNSTDDYPREGRISSPSKKHKTSGVFELAEDHELSHVSVNFSSDGPVQGGGGTDTELEENGKCSAKDKDACDAVAPVSQGQSLGPLTQSDEFAISTVQDPAVPSLGPGSSTGTDTSKTSLSDADSASVPATSTNLLSSSTASPQPNLRWEPSFSQNSLDQVSEWDVKDGDPVGAEREQLGGEPLVVDGAGSIFEPVSPPDGDGSGSLEIPHTPKARRTPLSFPPAENTTESFLLSSPSTSANPAAASSPAPAQRSPLPLGPAEPTSPVLDDAKFHEDASNHCGKLLFEERPNLGFMQPQSRDDSEMEERIEDENVNVGVECTRRNDEEQNTAVVSDQAEAGDEGRFENELAAKPPAELQAEIDRDDDDEGARSPINAQTVFDEEDSGEDDFTAALKLDISVFDQDTGRTIPAEALEDINEDDLSYEDFDSTLKSGIPMLDQDMTTKLLYREQEEIQTSAVAEARGCVANEEPVTEIPFQAVQVGSSIEQHPSSTTRDVANEEPVTEIPVQAVQVGSSIEQHPSSTTRDVANEEPVTEIPVQAVQVGSSIEQHPSSTTRDVANEEPVTEIPVQAVQVGSSIEQHPSSTTRDVANEEPVTEIPVQAVQVGSSIEQHPSSTTRDERSSIQSLVDANVGGKDETDVSQEQESHSCMHDIMINDLGGTTSNQIFNDSRNEMDELTANDFGGTSISHIASGTQNEQEGTSSGIHVEDGKAFLCIKCGSRRMTHRCSGTAKAGGKEPYRDSSLSPDGASRSPEDLEKSQNFERLEIQDGFCSRDKIVAVKLEKLEGQEDFNFRDKVVTAREVKVEISETKEAATRSLRQSNSGVTRLKVKMSSEVSVKQEVGLMPATLAAITEAPITAKGLLATGILSGHRVRYMDRHGKVMLTGRINDTGVVCDCSKCKGKQTVNVSAFEKHAGSSARHPSDYIYIENGKNLHEIMEAGWKATENGRKVSEALFKAMGPEPDKVLKDGCAKCGTGSAEVTCTQCPNLYHLGCVGLTLPPDGDWQCPECGPAETRPSPKIHSSLTRESSSGKDSNANLHKALFVPGGLPDDTELGYYVKGQRYRTGVKKGLGILCGCCQQVVSCSQFEQHAGWGSRRNPYSSIYLPNGQSLHIAALALGQKKGGEEPPVENVDYCTECGDGGDLVLCDSCPGAYHPECAGLVSIPAGNWFCSCCKRQSGRKVTSKIKLRGSSRAGGTPGKENNEEHCTRLLKASDTVSSGCVFCRSGAFEKNGFGPRTILLCDQCEREYHVGCLKEHGLANLQELPEGEWFCGKECQHIHSILNLLVANGMEPLADSIISKVIDSKNGDGSTEDEQEPENSTYAWQLLHGRRGDPVNGKTLSQAVAIFSESFDPIVDESSGRDLIPLMVHSRNTRDQDFGGMHCVVLKRNDEVVTAAIVRIFGRQFAELPLVATKVGSTGQGFCKALMLSIERLLGVLHVQRLVLPAAEGAEGIWVKKFAFSKLSDEESRRYRSEVQMMIFKGSSLLQKPISALAIR